MKKLYTLSAFLLMAGAASAQVFWTEDFGTTGCNRGALASAYTGNNGAWAITNPGSNGNVANTWYVSSASAGTGAGNCASSCVTANTQNPTLHLSNVTIVIPSFLTVGADTGASYFSGGFSSFGYTANTDRRAESPTINCTGRLNITATFVYLENGDLANDDGSFQVSTDGGTTWTMVDQLAKTPVASCGSNGQWTSITVSLPAAANNNANVKIGFHWVNNDDGAGTDPSFSVDDISLTSNPLGIPVIDPSDISVYSANGLINVRSDYGWKLLSVYNMLGEAVSSERDGNTISVTNDATGIYIVSMEVNGQRITKKVMIQ
ncbi:MAG TPA: T9SS type A sorting domain-containing protein [Bacteroidia bacterium]|jgi:hypothetical protein|nr:T9SS type A sorting domain-containing protein [Bacteroidia bacterium]